MTPDPVLATIPYSQSRRSTAPFPRVKQNSTYRLSELQKRKLTKLFGMYNASNTGVLTLADFEKIASNLASIKGLGPDSWAYHQLSNSLAYCWISIRAEVKESLARKYDPTITLEEWLRYHEQVLAEDTYRNHIDSLASLVFDAIDVDEDGYLSNAEWNRLFQAYHIPVVYADSAFVTLDDNRDGYLSKDEVMSLIEEFYYSQNPDEPGNTIFGPV